jgi:intracellular sulfur oxidation DsrE/DsrF family protein
MRLFIFCVTAMISFTVSAGPEAFSKGPVFPNFGENTLIEGGLVDAKSQQFKVLFDVSKKNDGDAPHRSLNTVARFINMHVRAGVPIDNIAVAIVVHGEASFELIENGAYQQRFTKNNPSNALLGQLLAAGVRVILCGQSASHHDIQRKDLVSGVELSLSAMTANALLQQAGYTLNPF